MVSEAHGPIEGGGKHGPFREDFFQRITNVSWTTKSRFMLGTYFNNNVQISDTGKSWTGAGFSTDSGVYGGMWCRTGGRKKPGKSIWLMGMVQSLHAAILVSNDGRTWHTVSVSAPGAVSEVYGFSYDVDTGVMYAGVGSDPIGGGEASYFLYRSTDGESWSASGSARGMFLPGVSTDGATEESMKFAQVSGGGVSGILSEDYPNVITSVGKLKDGKIYKARVDIFAGKVIINGVVANPFPDGEPYGTSCISFGVGTDGPVFVAGGTKQISDSDYAAAVAWSADGRSWNRQTITTLSAFTTAIPTGPFYPPRS